MPKLNHSRKGGKYAGGYLLSVCSAVSISVMGAWGSSFPGSFVVALARDVAGKVWVGTEDGGVFCGDISSGQWRQFKGRDGPGDVHVYAVSSDKFGRIWCGTSSSGVGVFNGREWRSYGIGSGLLGERVFDICCSPVDGDVWVATSVGLARYRLRADQWSYYTRMNGLSADQVQSLAFNAQGDVFAGLQCGGVAIARASERHTRWEISAAPWYFDAGQRVPYPMEPEGDGLPSNLVNALLVTRDGTVWAATVAGLAWSVNGGRRWRFLRGRDYADRVKGAFGGAPQGWKPPPKETAAKLLPEDYVTCLAEAPDGTLWLGFREQGCAAFDPKTLALRQWVRPDPKSKDAILKDGYVSRLLPVPDGRILVGGYGGGLSWITPLRTGPMAGVSPLPRRAESSAAGGGWPSSAAPPTDEYLDRWIALLKDKGKRPLTPGSAVYLGEDWTTRGDWIGRYGRRFAMLCAMNAPRCDYVVDSDSDYRVAGMLGPHFRGQDALRHWIHWIKTEDVRSLYSPTIAIRRQSEWDDHGETYPMWFDGPDVWTAVRVPGGAQKISLYFLNKDGHTGKNRLRDYLLEVRQYESSLPEQVVFNSGEPRRRGLPLDIRSADLTNVIPCQVLARARVRDFWGGVYKTFAVQGPGVFYLRVARHGSFNAIVSGVLVEKSDEPFEEPAKPRIATRLHFDGVVYSPPDARTVTPEVFPSLARPLRLWTATQDICGYQGGAEALVVARCLAYRATLARQGPQELMDNWRWHLSVWDDAERLRFRETMMQAWSAAQDRYAFFRSAESRPYSPNVVPFSVAELKEMSSREVDWRQFIAAGKGVVKEIKK